ncbi:MAG: hypothetical protein Fues2KO_40430 [Fuerstiella sp.]
MIAETVVAMDVAPTVVVAAVPVVVPAVRKTAASKAFCSGFSGSVPAAGLDASTR